ncbi:MAG TPA: hypothetical protein VLM89_02635 [Phycisphaerae bacterium]|nr:hypothetical protein [Phycisphaerae bacterium]
MRRVILAWLLLAAPVVAILAAGCEQEVKSVQKTERIEQTEPRMVSPGTEVVE